MQQACVCLALSGMRRFDFWCDVYEDLRSAISSVRPDMVPLRGLL